METKIRKNSKRKASEISGSLIIRDDSGSRIGQALLNSFTHSCYSGYLTRAIEDVSLVLLRMSHSCY
jgi:hypothetical protein